MNMEKVKDLIYIKFVIFLTSHAERVISHYKQFYHRHCIFVIVSLVLLGKKISF
jgi:hypothetical protein